MQWNVKPALGMIVYKVFNPRKAGKIVDMHPIKVKWLDGSVEQVTHAEIMSYDVLIAETTKKLQNHNNRYAKAVKL